VEHRAFLRVMVFTAARPPSWAGLDDATAYCRIAFRRYDTRVAPWVTSPPGDHPQIAITTPPGPRSGPAAPSWRKTVPLLASAGRSLAGYVLLGLLSAGCCALVRHDGSGMLGRRWSIQCAATAANTGKAIVASNSR
jgi:hypothetical protein